MKIRILWLGLTLGGLAVAATPDGHGPAAGPEHGQAQAARLAHAEEGHAEEREHRVHLSPAQLAAAGIRVEPLAAQSLGEEIEAPGEVRANLYATSRVTPRVAAQVVERHVRLGDRVDAGAPLVTLSSIELAEAQGALRVAAREWRTVSALGRQAASERRFIEAQVAWQQAQARLSAYGMGTAAIKRLAEGDSAALADGRLTLHAPQAGTVVRDDFVLGQMVNPGELLFELTDETTLWVEARVAPDQAAGVADGAPAWVGVGGNPLSPGTSPERRGERQWVAARVIHLSHTLNETTRTLAVRLELPNADDRLHPGQFVRTRIQVGAPEPALVLPAAAVLRGADGDWQVFIEEAPGEFVPREVDVVRQLPGRVVIAGVEAGTRLVTQGAFFVQSELAKAGFAVHNH